MSLTLCLPHEAASVPLSRKVASDLLQAAGFVHEEVADVELALSEACGNVVRHSQEGEAYELRLTVRGDVVSIDVEDKGPGFPTRLLDAADGGQDDDAETGRGILLMRALVDELRFEPAAGNGSVVRMVRTLHALAGSPAEQLLIGGS